ncbi:hypothetical protein BV25DRAFT_1229828 [Artomyces pyxidatus]|uniref:Uncharacterized protein n=1 Tax=Artomyces pyxidatus TaxID=48021 RepID=A0ACB8SQR8_9AGAM|nr:hypothetical protein BV25DRAFT_1229828 [Artomyces pyxidatus]
MLNLWRRVRCGGKVSPYNRGQGDNILHLFVFLDLPPDPFAEHPIQANRYSIYCEESILNMSHHSYVGEHQLASSPPDSSSTGIYKLPVEVLVEIFSLTPQGAPGQMPTCIVLRLVCRHWRDVVDDCHALWSTPACLEEKAWTTTMINRLASVPLHVLWTGPGVAGGQLKEEALLMTLVPTVFPRIQTLVLEDPRGNQVSEALGRDIYTALIKYTNKAEEPPQLRELRVNFSGQMFALTPLFNYKFGQLHGRDNNPLRVLRLSHCKLGGLPLAEYPNLTELELNNCEIHTDWGTHILWQLEHAKNLRSLSLRGQTFPIPPLATAIAVLPHLHTLHLAARTEHVAQMLGGLQIASCRTLSLAFTATLLSLNAVRDMLLKYCGHGAFFRALQLSVAPGDATSIVFTATEPDGGLTLEKLVITIPSVVRKGTAARLPDWLPVVHAESRLTLPDGLPAHGEEWWRKEWFTGGL